MFTEVPYHMKSRRGRNARVAGRGPDIVDVHVGKRVKLRRTMLHISQEKLAGDLGVTFQQVQKYESGHNRISASRLFDISRVLNCPISYFFEDIGPEITEVRNTPTARTQEAIEEIDTDPMKRTESLELVRSFWRIHNPELRQNVLELIANMTRRE